MVSTVFFTGMLYFKHELIGVYWKGDGGLFVITPVFVDQRLETYIPIILALAVLQYIILIWKFISIQWNKPLAIANTVSNIASCLLLVVMIRDNSLFNQEFSSQIARLAGVSLSQVTTALTWGILNITIIFVLISAWDSVKGFRRSPKKIFKLNGGNEL